MEEGSKKNNNGSCAEASSKPKRRHIKTAFQLEVLERTYITEKCISAKIRAELSVKLGLTDQQLQSWFYRREQKDRKQVAAPVAKIAFDFSRDELKRAVSRSGSGWDFSRFSDHDETSLRREQVEVQLGGPVRKDGLVLEEKTPVSGDSSHLVLEKGKKMFSDSMKATLAKMKKVDDSGKNSRDGGKKHEETSLYSQNSATSATEQIRSSVRKPDVVALDKEPIPANHESSHWSPSSPITLRKRGRKEVEGTGQSLPGVLANPTKQKVVEFQGLEPGQGCCVTVGPDEKWNAGTMAPTHALKIFTLLQDAEHYVDISRKEKAERMRRRAGQFMADAMVIAAEYEATADAEESKEPFSEVESLKKKNKELEDRLAKSSSKIEDLVAQKTNLDWKLEAWKERAEKAEGFNAFLSSQVKELKKKLENNPSDHKSELESLRSAHESEIKKLSAELEITREELETSNKEALPLLRVGYSTCLNRFVDAGADPSGMQFEDFQAELRNELRGYSSDDMKELIDDIYRQQAEKK